MSFAYTMMELETQDRRWLLLALVGLSVLFVLWGLWFVAAPITLTATSDSAELALDGSITTTVSPEILPDIAYGQAASFQVRSSSGQVQTLPAQVTAIDSATGTVTLVPTDMTDTGVFTPGMPGRVDFVIERLTPAQIVLRSVSQGADAV